MSPPRWLDRVHEAAARRPRRLPRRAHSRHWLSYGWCSASSCSSVSSRRTTERFQRQFEIMQRTRRTRGNPDPRDRGQRASRAPGHVHRCCAPGDEPARGDRGDAVPVEPRLRRRRCRAGRGDRRDVLAAEFRRIIGVQPAHDPDALQRGRAADAWPLFYGTPIRQQHCENYIRSFERLLRSAAACDPEGMIVDALHGNAQGRLYRVMCEMRDLSPSGG